MVCDNIRTGYQSITDLLANFKSLFLRHGTLPTFTEGGLPGFFISTVEQIVFVCGATSDAAKLCILGIEL